MDFATWWSGLFTGMSPASFFNFSFLPKYGVYFLQALGYTLLLAVISVLLAVIPALLLAFMRLSKNKFVRGISGAYIAIFRSTPLLVQLSIIYFGLFGAISIPRLYIFGFIDISRFIPGVVALALGIDPSTADTFTDAIVASISPELEEDGVSVSSLTIDADGKISLTVSAKATASTATGAFGSAVLSAVETTVSYNVLHVSTLAEEWSSVASGTLTIKAGDNETTISLPADVDATSGFYKVEITK